MERLLLSETNSGKMSIFGAMKILLVDDDTLFCRLLRSFLHQNNIACETATDKREALIQIKNSSFDLFLLDYRLPDGTGLEILEEARNAGISTNAVFMTSFHDVRTAVKAMHLGAFDYITKPVNHEELLMLIHQAVPEDKDTTTGNSGRFIYGESARSRQLMKEVDLLAPTDLSVIIQGESGTGKENVARLIHEKSQRNKKPFIAIDCGALSGDLVYSELFGHTKGAFTGALQAKKGKFAEANGGTVFLDEIGNLSYDIQVKLLRALQERVIQPLGSNQEIKVDIRLIVATNDDLLTKVSNGEFREDLYHRLNEYKIQVPSLRQRTDDFPELLHHFVQEANAQLGRQVKKLSPEVLTIIYQYDWPGNIRELKNIIKRLVLLTPGEIAESSALPQEMLQQLQRAGEKKDLWSAQEKLEKELIEETLRLHRFNKSKAARDLNIDRSTLYAKMEKYGIS